MRPCTGLPRALAVIGLALFAGPAPGFMGAPRGDEAAARGADGFGAYARLAYIAAADWTEARQLSGNWSKLYSPREGRNLALLQAQGEAGIQYGNWRLGRFSRYEAILDTNKDTLDFLYLERNRLPSVANRSYQIDLYGKGIVAQGYRAEYSREFAPGEAWRIRPRVGLAVMDANRWRSGDLRGAIQALPGGLFAVNAQWNEYGTKKTFPFIQPGTPAGTGTALDFALTVDWGERHRLQLDVADAFSRIKWRELPSTVARVQSNTIARDTDGFIVYLPALQGQNARRELVTRFDPKYQASYERRFDWGGVGASLSVLRGEAFPVFFASRRFSWATLSASYNTRLSAVGVGVSTGIFSLQFIADHFPRGARMTAVNASAAFTF